MKKLITAAALALLLSAGAASAQTYPSGTTGTTGTTGGTPGTSAVTTGTAGTTNSTPGTPNTGAGGNTEGNLIVLGSSALLALGGAGYLARRARMR